jgi:hexosaminidase
MSSYHPHGRWAKAPLGYVVLPLVAMVALCAPATGKAATPMEPTLIPYPVKLEVRPGAFRFADKPRILVNAPARPTGEYLSDVLASELAVRLPVAEESTVSVSTGNISVHITSDAELGEEGYRMDVEPTAVRISAATAAGAFYGVQTLRQLIATERDLSSNTSAVQQTISCLHIEDQPRFHWRGLLLDASRHFFTVQEIERFLDLMAMYKFNTFHWHLTDDQGWRIEIKKYPRLTEVGAWRDDGPGKKYGGFYTQEQIRSVVAYAAARHITIVPEIEMPGHCQAALAAYPELSCSGGPFAVGTRWGIYKDVYCAGKDQTFEFLENVLTEVMVLFPSSTIHIGGDECPKDRWKACPDCQARIKSEGLKDEQGLQSYFIKRIDAFVATKGRRIIGWDEILEGGLVPGAAVMSWHGTAGAVAAATANHAVVLSPTSNCYFDYPQSFPSNKTKATGSYLPIEKVYSFNPMPAQLSPEYAAHVLGAQGNLWTEHIENALRLDYMAFPRACALAEVVWSPADHRTWDDFHRRLTQQLKLLDALHVNYYKESQPEAPSNK